MPRREKWGVVGAILVALDQEASKGDGARLSIVASRANIAYDRLQDYLVELEAQGLITAERVPTLTVKGREFLRTYREWLDVLARFGFVGRGAPRDAVRHPHPSASVQDVR